MTIFDPYSPFLRSFQAALHQYGSGTDITCRQVGSETLSESYFPKTKYGIPCFDWERRAWESSGPSAEPENLMLVANQEGEFWIRQGDDTGVYFSTQLRSGFELAELLEFVETAEAERIGTSKWVKSNFHQLLEGVYLLMPGAPDLAMIPFESSKLLAERPNWNFNSSLKKEDLTGAFTPSVPSRNNDLILDRDGSVNMLGLYKQDADSQFGDQPSMVLRLRSEVSQMWFADYLEHTTEAAGVAQQILDQWRNLPSILKEIMVEMPTLKRDQVALAIELREAKRHYRRVIRALAAEREPMRQVIPLYRKRIRSVTGIHGDLLDEIAALSSPLPFFIEYPFRRYRRADDPLQKIKQGQVMLNLLAKIPLFLSVEELSQQGWKPIEPVLTSLRERPLSDGAILGLRRELGTLLPVDQALAMMKVFGEIYRSIVPSRELNELVEARNRYHHPPFVEAAFLETLERAIPKLVEGLRSALAEVKFLIPRNCQFKDGKRLIAAANISCSDAEFPSETFETEATFESFPVDALVAYRHSVASTVVLRNWITFRRIASQSFDFGVFDRMKGGAAEFSYVRDLA